MQTAFFRPSAIFRRSAAYRPFSAAPLPSGGGPQIHFHRYSSFLPASSLPPDTATADPSENRDIPLSPRTEQHAARFCCLLPVYHSSLYIVHLFSDRGTEPPPHFVQRRAGKRQVPPRRRAHQKIRPCRDPVTWNTIPAAGQQSLSLPSVNGNLLRPLAGNLRSHGLKKPAEMNHFRLPRTVLQPCCTFRSDSKRTAFSVAPTLFFGKQSTAPFG